LYETFEGKVSGEARPFRRLGRANHSVWGKKKRGEKGALKDKAYEKERG